MQPTTLAAFWDSPEPAAFRRVYHVSPTVLVPTIDHYGIDPAFSNGPVKACYFCEKKVLMWAVAHISAQKSISVDQLSIHRADIWKGILTCTNAIGVYTCRYVIASARQYSATDVFKWFHPDGSLSNG